MYFGSTSFFLDCVNLRKDSFKKLGYQGVAKELNFLVVNSTPDNGKTYLTTKTDETKTIAVQVT